MANTKKYISLDKLGIYDEKIKGVISAGDAAALKSAKDYADSLAGNYDAAGSATTAAAGVQANLDAEAIRAKAAEEANAKAAKQAQDEVDALELVVDTKADKTALDALAGKVGDVPSDKTVMGIIGEIQSGNATDNEAIQAQIDALSENKADKTQVATDIADAVKAESEARAADILAVQGSVNTLSGTHATDKKALEDAIALKADQTALDDVAEVANAAVAKADYDAKVEELEGAIALKASQEDLDGVSAVANAAVKQSDYDAKVEALEAEDSRIAGLVEAEAAKAREEEGKLDARLDKVEAFFEGAAEDGEGLQNALDTLVEIQTYVDTHGEAAAKMVEDIAANKKAIEDHEKIDHDFAGADAALKSELEGKINAKADATVVEGISGKVTTLEGQMTTVEGKVTTLEGEMDAVQAAVATKAEAEALADAIEALEGTDAELLGKIEAIEAKFGDGEGSVEDLIADAKQEAIDAAADAADVKDAAILAEAKADSSNKDAVVLAEAQKGIDAVQSALDAHIVEANAVAGRVTTVEGKVSTLESEMDAVEALAAANKAAHEANAAAIALKASQEDLNALDARVVTLETWHNNFTEASEEEINALFA